MEGPSLHLADEQLQPLIGQRIRAVSGNTTIEKERLKGEVVKDVFAWGKLLFIQFDDFALRTHFLLFGTFEAVIGGVRVTGDYERTREPRLVLDFGKDQVRIFNGSVKFVEGARVKRTLDLSVDIMARAWDPAKAVEQLGVHANEQIADVLLDQEIFAGVGNIIKTEVLALERIHPERKVGKLTPAQRKAVVARARAFSKQFLRWRRVFALRKHLIIYKRKACPWCGGPVTRKKTGVRQRWSHFCPRCQK